MGILEELDLSLATFCALGACSRMNAGKAGPGSAKQRKAKLWPGRRLMELAAELPSDQSPGDLFDIKSTGSDQFRIQSAQGHGGGGRLRENLGRAGSLEGSESSVDKMTFRGESSDVGELRTESSTNEGAADEGARPRVNKGGGRSILQKHSSKPENFKLGSKARVLIASRNALDVPIYELCKARLHTAAAVHAPADFARLKKPPLG